MLVRLVLIFCLFCGATAANCSYGGAVSTKELCIHVEKNTAFFSIESTCLGQLHLCRVNFDDAEKFCVQRGGHLASLHSQFDTNILLEFAYTGCHKAWIGGKILSQKGSWTDGTPFDYTPDQFELENGCLAVYTGHGEWAVEWCEISSPDCFACETPQMMSDCADYFRAGYTDSGMYRIWFDGNIYNVYCSMDNGGGWTVFQDRWGDEVSFDDRTWKEYQDGFNSGDPLEQKDWMGLDLLHHLTTKDSDVTLRIELFGNQTQGPSQDENWYIEYTKFKIEGDSKNYQLTSLQVDNSRRNASLMWDPMIYSVGANFSTVDKVNDPTSDCMVRHKMGGWWSNNCALSSLNGEYDYKHADGYGMFWMFDPKTIIHPWQTRMMLRPTSFPK